MTTYSQLLKRQKIEKMFQTWSFLQRVLKELRRLDEMESGYSDDSNLDGGKEYISPKEDTESSSYFSLCSSCVKFSKYKSKITIEESSKNYGKKICMSDNCLSSKLQSAKNKEKRKKKTPQPSI